MLIKVAIKFTEAKIERYETKCNDVEWFEKDRLRLSWDLLIWCMKEPALKKRALLKKACKQIWRYAKEHKLKYKKRKISDNWDKVE